MQRLALLLLGVAVAVEGAYVVSLHRSLAQLAGRLDHPAAAAGATAPAGTVQPALEAPGRPRPAGAVPVFASASPAAAPVLDALSSPQGRQRLQEVLASFKEERRREKMLSALDRRVQGGQRLRAALGELGLDAEQTRRTEEVLDRLAGQRRQALEELQSGARSRSDVKKDVDAAGRSADAALAEILGDKRMSALRDLRKRTERAPEPQASPAAAPL
jgi:hypothetical protein